MSYLYERAEQVNETTSEIVLTAPEFTVKTSNSYMSFTFTNNANTGATYSYSKTPTGNRTTISNNRISLGAIITSNTTITLYVFKEVGNAVSNYTSVTVTRSGSSSGWFGNYTYNYGTPNVGDSKTVNVTTTETIPGSEAALAMWSSGRVEGDKYEFFWFGPMRGRLDPWKSGSTPSYKGSETRKHFDMGYAPYGLWGVQDVPGGGSGTSNANRGAATVARCIREYDNASTATVAE